MKIMTMILLSFTLVISSTAIAADTKAAQAAIDKAETSRQHAASVGGEWRDTGKLIKKAKAALKAGEIDKAIKLARKAERQGSYGYDQAVSQKNQKNLTSPSYLSGSSISGTVVLGEGYITPDIKEIDVMHNGKPVTISRTKDKEATIKNHIEGFNAFIIVSFQDRFFFNAEYLGTINHIEMDSFDEGESYKPGAWTIEFAYDVNDSLNLAVCYEGSTDCDDFLPQKQFGGVVSYELFENTSVALEYLYGKFENKDSRHLMTTQLAIEF